VASRSFDEQSFFKIESSASRSGFDDPRKIGKLRRALRTGPATPKQAAWGCTSYFAKLGKISSRLVYSRLGKPRCRNQAEVVIQIHRRRPAWRWCSDVACQIISRNSSSDGRRAPIRSSASFGPHVPAACLESCEAAAPSYIEQRTYNAPPGSTRSPLEQLWSPIMQSGSSRLITSAGLGSEIIGVLKFHVHCAQLMAGPGTFAAKRREMPSSG